MNTLPADIFKAYDIRGIVNQTLTPAIVEQIGRAIGTEGLARKQSRIVLGRDGRLSGPVLSEALTRGILSTGMSVIDLGMVTTPMAYFAAHHLDTSCAAIVT